MAKLINEFSWSHSRRNAFEECMRKYYYSYYGSWNGWERDATDRQKELYLHNKLINRWMWLGKLVHESIKNILALVHRGAPLQNLEFYQDLLSKRMRSEFKDSLDGKIVQRPSKILGLMEHHYQEGVDDDAWRKIHQSALNYLSNFWNSEVFQNLKSLDPEKVLEMEKFSTFNLEGIKVWSVMDFCHQNEDAICIYDWKTGQSDSGATSDQLACYALYAHETWGVHPDKVQLIEYNLARNEITEHHTEGLDFAEVRKGILESASNMQSKLSDVENNHAEEDAFPATENHKTCSKCPFRGVCSESLIPN